MPATTLSVIIPACNEEAYIASCLDAVLPQAGTVWPKDAHPVEVIVVANACTDGTVDVARSFAARADQAGWRLEVLDLEQGGKLNALNVGESVSNGPIRIYMDADIVAPPSLVTAIGDALDRPDAAYASGELVIARAQSFVTRAYSRFWRLLPFVAEGVPGCGVYAVNAAGRARWRKFPDIISDDTFVRLQFAPQERFGVPVRYEWPMVEGFKNLVKVRKRQDVGVDEINRRYPELLKNEGKSPVGLGRLAGLAVREPVGFCVYLAVTVAVRLSRVSGNRGWTRGR